MKVNYKKLSYYNENLNFNQLKSNQLVDNKNN